MTGPQDNDLRIVLTNEEPLTAALDSLYGEGEWDEPEADALGNAICAAVDVLGGSGEAPADRFTVEQAPDRLPAIVEGEAPATCDVPGCAQRPGHPGAHRYESGVPFNGAEAVAAAEAPAGLEDKLVQALWEARPDPGFAYYRKIIQPVLRSALRGPVGEVEQCGVCGFEYIRR